MELDGKTVGIIYMAFGAKAAKGVEQSVASLRKLGLEFPVTVVGNNRVEGLGFREWQGQSPFDATQKPNFQFRAGRVKPFLYDYSPYDWTLYIDADTEFLQDITAGFRSLAEQDVAIAEERLTISQLYNKMQAGWEINIQEQRQTLREIGHDERFLNSGVIFFRKGKKTKQLFEVWAREWQRYQQWDEQLALTRAIYQIKGLEVKRLDTDWNCPQRNDSKTIVIFHNYGRGVVRSGWKEGNFMQAKKALQRAQSIPCYMSTDECVALFELAKETPKSGRIVEVGCLYGGATAMLCLGQPSAKVTIFDDFSWQPLTEMRNNAATLRANLEKVGVSNEIEIHEGDSRTQAREWEQPIDLLVIDGGHSLPYIQADLANLGPHANVIACHDYDNPVWPTIRQAVEAFIRQHTEWQVAELTGMLVTLRKVA
jgi:precorrin-6B methylase 2